MAGNEANIKVTADIQQAERQISKLAKQLGEIGNIRIKSTGDTFGGKALSAIQQRARDVNSEVQSLGNSFNRLGGLIRNSAYTGGLLTLAKVVSDVQTNINGMVSSIPMIGKGIAAQASQATQSLTILEKVLHAIGDGVAAVGGPGNAAGLAAVTGLLVAFGPQVLRAASDVEKLGDALGKLGGTKLSQQLNPVTHAVQKLDEELEKVTASFEDLLSGSTRNQLRDQLNDANKELGEYLASTQKAATAAEQLVAVKKKLNAEERALNDLVRKAQGLQPQDVRDAEAARRKAYLTSGRNAQKRDSEAAANAQTELAALRAKEAAESAAARERLKGAAAARTLVELAKQEAELAKQNLEVRYSWLKVLREGQAATAARQSRLQGANYGLGQVPAGGQLFPGGNTRTAQEGYRQMLNAQALTKQAAADALQKTQARTVLEGKSVEVLRTRVKALNEQAAIDARSVEILRQQNAERIKAEQLDARALTVARRQVQLADLKNKKKKGEEMQKRVENTLVSGAFPLLFGAGPAATIGGFAGGAMGGTNPMIGVFTSAIGQIFDTIRQNLTDLGKSLREPTSALQAMETAGLRVSDPLRTTVTRLSEVGRSYEAQAAIFASIKQQLGSDGLQALFGLIQEQKRLEESWSKLTSVLTSELLPALVGATSLFADLTGGLASLASIQLPDWLKGLIKRGEAAVNPFAALSLGLSDYGQGATRDARAPGLTPEVLQKDADARLATAERAEALRRQGVQLERQQQDLALSIADQVYGFRRRAADLERANIDLRRSVEDEIFRKRQEIARLEIDNERQKQQLAIERTDLALAGGRVSGNRPGQDLANGLLDALRQYVRGRAEAEADLQQKERTFQVEMVDLRRASERYRFEVERKVADLQRQAADYNRDVEKAKLTAERAIYDLQIAAADYRIAKAKEAIQLETQAVQQLAQTIALTGQVSGLGGGAYPVTSGRGMRRGRLHNGIDYSAPVGTPISTTLAGKVTDRGFEGGYGNYVEVQLENGVKAFWAHLSEIVLQKGQSFNAGQVIARTGNTGRSTGPHLHSGDRGIGNEGDAYTRLGGSPIATAPAVNNIVPTASAPRGVDTSGAMSALNGLAAPGVGSVSSLMSSLEQLDAKLIKTKELSLSLAKEFAAMTDKQRAEAWGNTVQAAIDSLNAPMDEILKKQGDQAAYQREYAELINKGVLPDLAKQILEIRDQVQLQLQQLDTAISVLEASKLKLEAEGKWTEELQKQLDILKEQKGIIEGKGQQAESGAKQAQSPGQRLNDAYTKVKGELNELTDPVNQIVAGANAIGSAFSTAFKGIASGAMTAQEALAQMFQSIANHFLDMAAQMIAKYIEMQIIGLVANFLGSAAGAGGGKGVSAAFPKKAFADGGFVTGPTRAMVGEGGDSEYVIPSKKMGSAMARWSAGVRGNAVVDGADAGGAGGVAVAEQPTQVNITGGVLNFDGSQYIKADQIPSIIRQGAKQGEAQAMRKLQMSPTARRRVGI